jgi:geranylgeranyl pyrophosphate synthase
VECGALADTERRIAELVAAALRALSMAGIASTPRAALHALAGYATERRW